MDNVLVTGGGGFIGGALVKQLVANQVQVSVIGRNPYPQLEEMGVACLGGGSRGAAFLEEVSRGREVVCHVAAKAGIWGPKEEFFSINADGTDNIVDACRKNKVSALVYTSTPSVVFAQKSIEYGDESLPYVKRPLCHYAASKIVAEKKVLAADSGNLRTTAIRPHLVWGPGDHHLIPRLLERGRQQKLKIVGNGSGKVDITYIDNVVHAHLLAADNLLNEATAGGEAFFIGQNEPVFLWEWVNDLFARVGVPQVTGKVPFPLAYLGGAVLEGIYSLAAIEQEPKMTRFLAHQLAHSHCFSHEKAVTLLGYKELVSTEEGLDRLVYWLGETL